MDASWKPDPMEGTLYNAQLRVRVRLIIAVSGAISGAVVILLSLLPQSVEERVLRNLEQRID